MRKGNRERSHLAVFTSLAVINRMICERHTIRSILVSAGKYEQLTSKYTTYLLALPSVLCSDLRKTYCGVEMNLINIMFLLLFYLMYLERRQDLVGKKYALKFQKMNKIFTDYKIVNERNNERLFQEKNKSIFTIILRDYRVRKLT